MRLRRLVTILANACALLLLGLVGVAMAGPSAILDGLDLYGPMFFSGVFPVDQVSGNQWLAFPSLGVSGSFYVVPGLSNLLSLLDANTVYLSSQHVSEVVVLPANDSLFASAIPEPIGLSLLVSGVAAVAFVRHRRARRSQRAVAQQALH